MHSVYLIGEFTKAISRHEIFMTPDGVKRAIARGEIQVSRTAGGIRLISQEELDKFIACRKAKKIATESKAA